MSVSGDALLEPKRLAVLDSTQLLASPPEEKFDRHTRLVAHLLQVPVALVSLVGPDHQFFKSCIGLPEPWASKRQTPLSHSFCQHVVRSAEVLAINDARLHPTLKDNLAVPDLGVVAYLGSPLITADGQVLGSLCAIDTVPREWTPADIRLMNDLAAFVSSEIDARRAQIAAAATENRLRKAEAEATLAQRVRSMADAMPAMVWVANPAGEITYYNQRWFEYTGMTFEQSRDWGWKPVCHPDELDRCVEEYTRSIRSGSVHNGEYQLRRGSDGEYRWHLCRAMPQYDASGNIIEWVGTNIDIHDLKIAEMKLASANEQLERRVEERTAQLVTEIRFIDAVVRNISDGIMACDATGRITCLNPAILRMAGVAEVPAREQMSQEWAEKHLALYDGATGERLSWTERPMARSLRGESVTKAEFVIKPLRGQPLNIVLTSRPMMDDEGGVLGAVCAWHDVTELRRSQRELITARETAEQANRSKSEFLANMSHEIRTPISAIIGFTDLMQRPNCNIEQQREYGDTVARSARHLLGLINDILDLSKVEAGKMTVERLPCELPPLLTELISTLRPRAMEKGLSLQLHFDGPVPSNVNTDALRLRQIVMNLIGNAIKFTEQGSIDMHVRWHGRMLSVEVRDTGVGMTEAQLRRLFQAFTQADESTTRKYGGTGLGLTISRQLARLLGGDIKVRSKPGEGTTFTLTIECDAVDASQLLLGVTEAGIPSGDQSATVNIKELRGRVLLVEDGRDNQRLLTVYLQEAGLDVTLAVNGRQAIEVATNGRFDCILMDMQMPEVDGYTAAAELRRLGCTVPIIALTAHAMAEDRAKCIAAGCTDYLSKPVAQDALIQTIAVHIGNAATRPQPDADIVIDVDGVEQPVDTQSADGTLYSTLRGTSPAVRKIVDDFVASLPAEIEALQALIDRVDLTALRRAAHELRGVGGGFGFAPITAAAGLVEDAVKSTDDLATIQGHTQSLIDVIRRVKSPGSDKQVCAG